MIRASEAPIARAASTCSSCLAEITVVRTVRTILGSWVMDRASTRFGIPEPSTVRITRARITVGNAIRPSIKRMINVSA